MKAVIFNEHGPTSNLHIGEIPEPECGPDDVIISVKAVALNGFDPMVVAGIEGLKIPLPMVPAGDVAGVVAKTGANVTEYKEGDRVTAYPFVPAEGMTGETRRGAAAEYIGFPKDHIIRIPDSVSFEDAAALPIAYGTAYRMIHARAQAKKGEKALVLGATGGVGNCAVLLLKEIGCEVIGCGSSGWKLDRLREIGCDHVIDTSSQDFMKACREIAGKPRFGGGGGGVDICINYIGGDTWMPSLRTLREGGRMLTCGATAGYDAQTDIRYVWSYELNIMGSNGWFPDDQVALLDAVAEKRLKPVIDEVAPMSRAGEMIQKLADRNVFGKVVLTPDWA